MSEEEYTISVSAKDAAEAARKQRFVGDRYYCLKIESGQPKVSKNGHLMINWRMRVLSDANDAQSIIGDPQYVSTCLPLRNPEVEGHEPHKAFFDIAHDNLAAFVDEPITFAGSFGPEEEDGSRPFLGAEGEFTVKVEARPRRNPDTNTWSYRGKLVDRKLVNSIRAAQNRLIQNLSVALYCVPGNLDLLRGRAAFAELTYNEDGYAQWGKWSSTEPAEGYQQDPEEMLEVAEEIDENFDLDSLDEIVEQKETAVTGKKANKKKK